MKALNAGIYAKLAASTGLTALLYGGTASGSASIFHMRAPDNAALPYVVFSEQGGGDENLTANRTKNIVEFVRGYATGPPSKAAAIDAQIDLALHDTSPSVTGYTTFWCMREMDLETVEVTAAGVPVFMAGATYRIRLDSN